MKKTHEHKNTHILTMENMTEARVESLQESL